jgi:hypothetical protein
MNTSIVAGSLLAALTLATPVHGQVAADVIVRSGPIAGHVVVGDGHSTYRRPVAYRRTPERVIVVERYAPRIVVVERLRGHRHWRNWRAHGYRPVTLYFRNGRYYDRDVRGWTDVRQVVVYERDGRFYRECDDDRDHDRHDRYDHDRYDHDRDWDD